MANGPTKDQYVGCLLGLAIGDALGAPFEGQSLEGLARRYRSAADLMEHPPYGELWYTDDTQMTIGVAQNLLEHGHIEFRSLCQQFAKNYLPQRGYGRGAKLVLEAMLDGDDHEYLAANLFPGGSYGNGAAMRVAPIGLVFAHDLDQLWDQAAVSARPTHVHPHGIEGAQLLALAVGLACGSRPLDRKAFFGELIGRAQSLEFQGPLTRAATLTDVRDLGLFGNGIEATNSVVTAIAAFGLSPEDYGETVGNCILLGGDCDTLAAMAGAISGAHLGTAALPPHLLNALEDRHQGRSYLSLS